MPYSRHTLRFRDAPALHFYRIPVRTRRNGFRPAPPSYGRACCPTAGCSRTSGRDSRPDVFNPPFESSGSPCESAPSGSQPWPSPDRLPSGLFPMPGQKSGGNPDTARYLNKSGRNRSVRSNACCSCHFSISAKLPDKSTSGTLPAAKIGRTRIDRRRQQVILKTVGQRRTPRRRSRRA